MPKFIRRRSLGQIFDQLVRKYVWGMKIYNSAWIARTAFIDRTWPRGITIRKNCVIGEEASILTHDMSRGIYLDTCIGDRTTVSTRAIIMPGISIGEGSTIETGSVVTADLEARSHVRGDPLVIHKR